MGRARFLIRLTVLGGVLLGLSAPNLADGQWFKGRGRGGLPGGAAKAPAAPVGPQAVAHPDWISRPTVADIAKVYPARARSQGQQGLATLRCTVKQDGGLALCVVAHEYPDGFDFGAGAIKLAAKFRMKPQEPNGTPVAERPVSVLVQFQLP